MTETLNLLPELENLLGNVFKPELEQILLYFHEEKVWVKLVFSKESGIENEETDLSFIYYGSEPLFTVANSLEHNQFLLFTTDTNTQIVALNGAFTEEGFNELIGD